MDRITKEARSRNMSRIRSENTAPELKLRRYLHKKGYRYRVHYPVTGKPDIAFPKDRIAIFIHGCFWHCHGCKNSVLPKTNRKFWKEKLNKNVVRDKKTIEKLKSSGWHVKIVWECKLEGDSKKTLIELINFFKRKKLLLK